MIQNVRVNLTQKAWEILHSEEWPVQTAERNKSRLPRVKLVTEDGQKNTHNLEGKKDGVYFLWRGWCIEAVDSSREHKRGSSLEVRGKYKK